MQQLWNWLMHADAKALFLACLLALIAMLGWRGYVEFDALRDAQQSASAEKAKPTLPNFAPYHGLGILEYVDEQARPDAQALPVDLFRPTLDAMVSNLVNAILTNPTFTLPPANPTPANPKPTLKPGEENLFDVVQQPNGQWVRRPRAQPPAQLTYNGVFQRTDGHIAAWVTEKNSKTTKFYGEGDDLFGAKLESVDKDEIKVRFPNGEVRTLPRGGSVTLPGAAAPAVPETTAVAAAPTTREGGDRHGTDHRTDGGVFRRGGAQRMPTEQEIAAIERANPELAQRIRDAIRRRQEQDQQRGANP